MKNDDLFSFEDINNKTATLYKTNMKTNSKEKIADSIPYFGTFDSSSISGFVDNYVIIDMREFVRKGADEDRMKRYAISLDTREYIEINLNKVREENNQDILFDPIRIQQEYKHMIIVDYGFDFAEGIFNGQATLIGVPKYGLISKQDFFESVANYKPFRYLE